MELHSSKLFTHRNLFLLIVCILVTAIICSPTMTNLAALRLELQDKSAHYASEELDQEVVSQIQALFTEKGASKSENKDGAGFQHAISKAASLAFADSTKKPQRHEFVLNAWNKKTSGGLTDVDRMTVSKNYRKANSVFEWGLGESTMIADHVGVPRYAGIDSDPSYVAKIRAKVSDKHFRFYFADIGETVQWGNPKQNHRKNFYNYQIAPLMSEVMAFDVYMVDGRYRLACLVMAFLHASSRGAKPADTIVMVHDCERSEYHLADQILKLGTKPTGGKICVYMRNEQTTDEQLVQLWMKEFHKIG